jgi:anti-sigma factor RsiW
VSGASEQQSVGEEGAADPRLTELVAYLDGELPAEASERLEQQLAEDAPLRREAADLDRTWQMLNLLEEVPASAEFVGKTLATIQAMPGGMEPGEQSVSRWFGIFRDVRLLLLAGGLLLGFGAASAGLLISREGGLRSSEGSDVEILQQLDLLQRYPQLRAVPDVEFLRGLAAAGADGGVKP